MGLGSFAAGAAVDAAQKQAEMQRMLKGRTPEQQKVIKYFYGAGGCLSKGLSDEEYDSMVMNAARSMDFRQKALNKIGVDESEVKEIEPVHFESYYFTNKNDNLNRFGNDYKWRSSEYMITWVFFGDSQIYVYQYTMNMASGSTIQRLKYIPKYGELYYDIITRYYINEEFANADAAAEAFHLGRRTFFRRLDAAIKQLHKIWFFTTPQYMEKCTASIYTQLSL